MGEGGIRQVWVGGVINQLCGGAISQVWGAISQVWGGHQSSMGGSSAKYGGPSVKYGGVISQVWGGHQPTMGGHQPSMGGGYLFSHQYVQELKIQRITLATHTSCLL